MKEVCFAYDPLGRRISKEFDGKTTNFLWDGDKIVHEWVEEIGKKPKEQPTRLTAWLFDEDSFTPLAKLTSEQIYTVISNHLGTPNTMLDQNGKVVWETELDLFGRPILKEGGDTEETKCLFRFPGQYEDEETGLYYNRFRYYDPQSGMYTQRDPIGLAGGNPTLYAYVHDPNAWIDPFGLWWWKKIIGTAQSTGTLGHATVSKIYAHLYAMNPKVAKVTLNKGYNSLHTCPKQLIGHEIY